MNPSMSQSTNRIPIHRLYTLIAVSIHGCLLSINDLTADPTSRLFHSGTKQHAVLNPRLDRIQKSRLQTCTGTDGEKYYQISFEIHAVYYSAHCEYTLWYEGKDHGRVKVDYV